jgi:hypothetical protein
MPAGWVGTLDIAVVIFLVFGGVIVLMKVCRTEVQEFREFFDGISRAALSELSFAGGRAAKANVVLCIIVAVLFVFVCLPDEAREFRALLDGAPESAMAKYVLFGSLLVFFIFSLCFVYAIDRYSTKTKR